MVCGVVWCEPCPLFFSFFFCSSLLCVRCHSIVGLAWCVCGRVLLLWNGGGGLWWAEGCVVSAAYYSTLYVLWCASQCSVCGVCGGGSACRVMSHCAVEWRWVVLSSVLFSLFFSSSVFVLVFGVVRAQLCEHARYPRTPLRFLFLLLFFSPLFCSSPFFMLRLSSIGMAVCGSPCVGVFGGHDGDG